MGGRKTSEAENRIGICNFSPFPVFHIAGEGKDAFPGMTLHYRAWPAYKPPPHFVLPVSDISYNGKHHVVGQVMPAVISPHFVPAQRGNHFFVAIRGVPRRMLPEETFLQHDPL